MKTFLLNYLDNFYRWIVNHVGDRLLYWAFLLKQRLEEALGLQSENCSVGSGISEKVKHGNP